ARESVCGETVGVVLAPPAPRNGDNTGTKPRGYPDRQPEGRAIVPDYGLTSVRQTHAVGVVGVELQVWSALFGPVLGMVRMAGVQESTVLLRSQEHERVFLGECRVSPP